MKTLHTQAVEIGKSREKGAVFKDLPVSDDDVREICNNKHLVNITLEGTNISDKALEYLATLPNLSHLHLGDTQITGAGFTHFKEHKKLECVGMENTLLNDENLKIVSKIPKIRIIRIDNTKVTFEGVLAVSDNKRLSIVSHTQFSQEQIKTFKQMQRDFAKKKTSVKLSEEDMQNAKNHLLKFFVAMREWEKFAHTSKDRGEKTAKIKTLYQEYATEKWHDKDRYSYSTMSGGTYGKHQIVDYETISKNRIYVYTDREVGSAVFNYRFLMIRQKDNSWKIDGCQQKFGNWEKITL